MKYKYLIKWVDGDETIIQAARAFDIRHGGIVTLHDEGGIHAAKHIISPHAFKIIERIEDDGDD